jgi:hypothetical protein
MTPPAPRFRITELHPLATTTRDECESHYVSEHIPMIVQARRSERDVRVLRYRPHRADAALSPDLTWVASEKYWRFVFVNYLGDGTLGRSNTRHIAADHRHWVQDLRSYEVANAVRIDRRSGQLASAKYLLVGSGSFDQRTELAAARDGVHSLFKDAFGARLYLTNDAIAEQEAVDDQAPRQRFTRNTFDVDCLRWYDELYFDSESAGAEYFATSGVLGLLVPGTTVLRLSEVVAYDIT